MITLKRNALTFAILFWFVISTMVGFSQRVVSVKGSDAFKSTIAACTEIGLQAKVKAGMRVGILVNSDFEIRGAYTDPDVTIAVVKMCFDAGASEVVALQHIKQEYWERSSNYSTHAEMISRIRNVENTIFPSVYDSTNYVKFDSFPGAPHLKGFEMVKEVFHVDLFINIPIAKHHSSTILTNAMKTLMGLNTRTFNVTFHLNGPKRNDPDFLATCIAELNLVRKPDLIVSDVSFSIITNGPNGPGETVSPMCIVAGTDPVAIDAYCATLIGFDPARVLTIQKGFELGLGEKDMNKIDIFEVEAK